MAAVDGDERVIAAAQHIVRSLGTTENMTKDMLRIFSSFDNRFSSMTERGDAQAHSEIEERLAFAEEMVLRWDMNSSDAARQSMIWEGPPDEAASYLHAVDEVHRLTESLATLSMSFSISLTNPENNNNNRNGNDMLDRAQSALHKSMARLEQEFRNLLDQGSEIFEAERLCERNQGFVSRVSFCSTSTHEEDVADDASISSSGNGNASVNGNANVIMDLISPEVIPHLKDIAERMVASDYKEECFHIYTRIRRDVLEEGLYRLGIEKLSIEEIQKMDWESLEGKMKKWNQAAKIAVGVVMPSEKHLCEQIFGELGCGEIAFVETAKGAITQLLNFGEAVAISRRSPERLFRILDMYECLSDLLPDINTIFSDESSVSTSVRMESFDILTRLGEAAKGTFREFENAIQRETSRIAIPGGAIHPLTRYVMNYIRFLFDYTDTLKLLLVDEGKEKKNGDVQRKISNNVMDYPEDDCRGDNSNMSPLAQRLLSIASLLELNLDGKSKLYKDVSLSHLFLMNNVRYIVQKVKSSELRTLLGDDWIRKHSGQVRQHATSYQRAAWNKVLSFLRDEGISITRSVSNRVSKDALKERFKSFNSAFEEVYRNQTGWLVPDLQLREELRISIAEKLLPAYRSFLGRFRSHLESGRHAERYIKYTPEDLETYLSDLFEGSPGSMHRQRRSSNS